MVTKIVKNRFFCLRAAARAGWQRAARWWHRGRLTGRGGWRGKEAGAAERGQAGGRDALPGRLLHLILRSFSADSRLYSGTGGRLSAAFCFPRQLDVVGELGGKLSPGCQRIPVGSFFKPRGQSQERELDPCARLVATPPLMELWK